MQNGFEDGNELELEALSYMEWLKQEFWNVQVNDMANQVCNKEGQRMTASFDPEYRTKFTPELKDIISSNLARQGIAARDIIRALKLWEDGASPLTPHDWGCFAVFDTIQKQIDAGR